MIADEAFVPSYQLPDPLIFQDGSPVVTPADWRARRREILDLFAAHVYGITPRLESTLDTTVVESDGVALGGVAVRRQTRLRLRLAHGGLDIDLLSYRPRNPDHRLPAIVIPNFRGNHTVDTDPAILICERARTYHGGEQCERGAMARRFPLEMIVSRGYQLVTFYYGDVAPDVDHLGEGRHSLFPGGEQARSSQDWGAVGAWAWGASRILDFLVADSCVDPARIFVAGHSRLGKAALWAAAQDERFAGVFANNSGCAGAALSARRFGETIEAINALFPHWFCRDYRSYARREASLPIDQHQLIAAIAPRPVYIASASEDLWGDPRGTYLALLHADPVYRFLGSKGLTVQEWPPQPTSGGSLGFHLRAGGHDLLALDWLYFLTFLERR
jgi:hypothetical protein